MDAFKQFANKNIFECAEDGFPGSFLRCMNPQAPQSSINDDVSKSEPGRNYMQATDKLGPLSFPSSYGEYAAVRIAVFLNYAPDDELDKKGNPTLHFQRDVSGKFYNITIRNLFDTMQTLMCLAGFDPHVAMLILLSSVVVMDTCMLMGPTKGWSDTEEYCYLSQFQLPFAKNIIEYVLGKCKNLVGVMVFGHKASENILPWLGDNYNKKLLIQGSDVFLSHPQNIRWRYTLKHAQHYTQMFSKIMVSLGVVIPSFVDGMQLLRCFLTKKYTLEMMKEFVDSEVLEAVRQRIAMVKNERTAKVEELKEIAVTVEGERARMAERDREEKKEKARQQEKEQVEHARQQEKEQVEHARQRKEEQEEQAPKARGKNKTFDDRMEDLKLFKETHGHVNVSIPEDNSLAQFCAQTRYVHNNPGKSKRKKLTIENIARLDAIGFNWTLQEYVTRSFDERIDDLEKYKRTHGHLNVKRLEDSSLYQFCAGVRHSLKMAEKDGTMKLTVERIVRLDALGFEWTNQR
jgi:hypothetical protein